MSNKGWGAPGPSAPSEKSTHTPNHRIPSRTKLLRYPGCWAGREPRGPLRPAGLLASPVTCWNLTASAGPAPGDTRRRSHCPLSPQLPDACVMLQERCRIITKDAQAPPTSPTLPAHLCAIRAGPGLERREGRKSGPGTWKPCREHGRTGSTSPLLTPDLEINGKQQDSLRGTE